MNKPRMLLCLAATLVFLTARAAAAQTMICVTTTETTTYYLSDRSTVTYTQSVRVCWPINQS